MENSKKCKLKVSLLKYLLHELNCVLGKHCLRSPQKKKKNALCIAIQAITNK